MELYMVTTSTGRKVMTKVYRRADVETAVWNGYGIKSYDIDDVLLMGTSPA